jgi:hypothetical protein
MHILSVAEAIEEFDVDMYFVLIENIVVNDSRKLTMSLGASEERFCRCKRNLLVPDGYRDVNYEADICFDACSGFLHE